MKRVSGFEHGLQSPARPASTDEALPQTTSRAERWRVAWVLWEWCLIREACRLSPYRFLVMATLVALFFLRPNVAPPWKTFSGHDIVNVLFLFAGFLVIVGGCVHAAHAVCWEVSRELRDMVRLTGISPGTLLWCKTLARWWTIFVSIVLLIPFAAFAVTQGGVTIVQLWAEGWWLLMFGLLTAGFAAIASVSSVEADSAATTATAATFFLMLLYHGVFWLSCLALELGYQLLTGNAIQSSRVDVWLASIIDFMWNAAPSTGAYRAMSAPVFHFPLQPTYWLHFLTAAVCLRLASRVMRNRMRISPQWDTSPAAANDEPAAVAAVLRPRCTERPFFWKDTQILSGGPSTQRIADVVHMLFAVAVLSTLTHPNSPQLRPAIAVIAECLAPIVIALRFDALLAAEFRQQTWASLMLLPVDPFVVVRAKLQAALWEQRLIWLPLGLAFVLGLSLQPSLVAMGGVIAALAGIVLCQVSAISRLAPRTWWVGPTQGLLLIGLIAVCVMTWCGNPPWLSFAITVALLLVFIFPAQAWIDHLLRNWTEG